MKNTMSKLLACLLSFMMLFSSLPITAIAEGISTLLPESPISEEPIGEGKDEGEADAVADFSAPYSLGNAVTFALSGVTVTMLVSATGNSSQDDSKYFWPSNDYEMLYNSPLSFRITVTKPISDYTANYSIDGEFTVDGVRVEAANAVEDVWMERFTLKKKPDGVTYNTDMRTGKIQGFYGGTLVFESRGNYTIPDTAKGKQITCKFTISDEYGSSESQSMTIKVSENDIYTFGYSMAIADTDFIDKVPNGTAYNPGKNNNGTQGTKPSYIVGGDTAIMENGVTSGKGAQKYIHNEMYNKGDKITITSSVPVHLPYAKDNGYTFVAWFNKTNGVVDKGTPEGNSGTTILDKLYNPGNTIIRSNITQNDFTIDAIWSHIIAEDNILIYDGKKHGIEDPKFFINAERNDKYYAGGVFDQLVDYIVGRLTNLKYTVKKPDGSIDEGTYNVHFTPAKQPDERDSYYPDESDIIDLPTYSDVGRYTYNIAADFDIKGVDRHIETTVTLTILPRPVIVQVNDGRVAYDGAKHIVTDDDDTDTEYQVWEDVSKYDAQWALIEPALKQSMLDHATTDEEKANVNKNWNEWLTKRVTYSTAGYYLANAETLNNADKLDVVYYDDIDDPDSGDTAGKIAIRDGDEYYPATIDDYSVLTVTQSGVPTTDNYVFIMLPGELRIYGGKIQIIKTLVDAEGNPVKAEKDETFEFEVAGGKATPHDDPNGDIKITIKKGESSGSILLDAEEDKEYTVTETTTGYETWYTTTNDSAAKPQSNKVTAVKADETGDINQATVYVWNRSLFEDWVVEKDVDKPVANVGDTLTYTIVVTNNSNQELTKPVYDTIMSRKGASLLTGPTLVESDAVVEDGAPKSTDGVKYVNGEVTIPVGGIAVFTATYVVTKEDREVGRVKNHVLVSTDLYDDDEHHQDDAETLIPKWKITKTVDKPVALVGEELLYTIKLKNTGEVELDLVLTDTFDGVAANYYNIELKRGNATQKLNGLTGTTVHLAVGEEVTITYNYKVDANDPSPLDNTITADDPKYCVPGDPEKEDPDTEQDEHDEDHEAKARVVTKNKPNFTLEKKVYDVYGVAGKEDHEAEVAIAGDTLTYVITIKNTGTIVLKELSLKDVFTGATGTTAPAYDFTAYTLTPANSGATVTAVKGENTAKIYNLGIGESITFMYEYTPVLDTDRLLDNVVTVKDETTYDPDTTDTTGYDPEKEDDTEVPVAHIDLVKVVNNEPDSKAGWRVGETVIFKITVTNDGSVKLYNVVVTDEILQSGGGAYEIVKESDGDKYKKDSATQATIPELGVGESVDILVKYTVVEKDVGGDSIKNHAKAKGNTDPDPDPENNPENKTVEDEDEAKTDSGIWVVEKKVYKYVEGQAIDAYPVDDIDGEKVNVGDKLIYIITVTNTGKVDLKDLRLTDYFKVNGEYNDGLVWNTNPDPSKLFDLAAGVSIRFSATYTVTDTDYDLYNKVIVDIVEDPNDPSDPPPEDNPEEWPEDDVENPVEPKPQWKVVKDATVERGGVTINVKNKNATTKNGVYEGETITYTITIENKGNVALEKLEITDTLFGGKQEKLEYKGAISSTGRTPVLTPDGTGNNKWILDELLVGETVTLTYTYTVQKGDRLLNNNVKTRSPKYPDDPEDPDPDHEDETETPVKQWTIVKDATVTRKDADGNDEEVNVSGKNGKKHVYVGETITYTITVTNTGEATLETLEVTDKFDGYNPALDNFKVESNWKGEGEAATWEDKSAFPIKIFDLKPGESVTFTYTYTVQDGDKELHNVTAATDPEDPDNPPPTDETETPVAKYTADKKLVTEVPKDEEGNETGFKAGDWVEFVITVTNTGAVTLTNIALEETLEGAVFVANPDADPAYELVDAEGDTSKYANIPELESGKTATLKAKYQVTQADVDNGGAKNIVVVTPDDPGLDPEDPEEDIPTDDPKPAIKVVKETSNNPDHSYKFKLGETIEYKITVTNTGNVTLYDVEVVDELTGNVWTVDELAPDESKTFTTSYVVTEADILAGKVHNDVTARGRRHHKDNPDDPDDPDDPHDEDEVEDPTEDPDPAIKVIKETSNNPDHKYRFKLGETIEYSITVINTGNVTLTDVKVEDPLTGDVWMVPTLAVGESETFTTSHVVTEADVLAGTVFNDVTARGRRPHPNDPKNPDDPYDPEDPSDEDEVEDPTEDPNPAIKVVKNTTNNPDHSYKFKLGETIEYSITVTNTGNVTLTDVKVEDELTGDVWTVASLAPGASATFTASHVVTAEDIAAGKVLNDVTARGRRPHPNDPKNPDDPYDPEDPSDEDEVEDPTEDPKPAIKVVKTTTNNPDHSYKFKLGETIEYSITVTNTGNVALVDVKVEDELTGNVWTVASLAVGESATFTTSHVVTAEDVAAGKVLNEVTAKGRRPHPDDPKNPDDPYDPDDPSDEDEVEDPTEEPKPAIKVVKTTTNNPDHSYKFKLGETIEYSITVTNTGNVTLINVKVEDELTGDVWMVDTLAPGESKTFTASHVVTEADVAAGSVLNEVTAKGRTPDPENPDDPKDPEDPTNPDDPYGPDDPHDEDEVKDPTDDTPAEPTATPTVPTTTTVRGTKIWRDNSDSKGLRPDSIEVILYADGEPTDEVPTWTKDGDTWRYVFNNLPYADENGRRIVYTVVETPVPEYTTSYDGTTITNTLNQQYVSISGHKTWNDNDNAAGLRPDSIRVRLMRDGVVVEEIVVTEADGWSYTFTNVPTSDPETGIDYVYTIGEAAVSGYYTITDGMNLVNTLLPVTSDEPEGFARIQPNMADLLDMIQLFGYETPLWGTLLKTGLEVPAYPFIFGGLGVAALILLAVLSRKKRKA